MHRLWIDITNSPHVLFFAPIIRALQRQGVPIKVTTRDYQQTIGLLQHQRIEHTIVGRHYGKHTHSKAVGLLLRSALLCREMLDQRQNTVSISHGSPYCSVASYFLGIPNIWTSDNDQGAFNIRPGVTFATRILIPQAVPPSHFVCYGADASKIWQYIGLKEEVYLHTFTPNPHYYQDVGINAEQSIVLVRPEAAEAIYIHETDCIIPLIRMLQSKYCVVLLPRTHQQRLTYEQLFPDVHIPALPLDGPNLIANADLVVGAGGTMNREAVVLGTPVISMYRERLLAIDQWLITNHYMLHNPDPTVDDVESAMNGESELYHYASSDQPFRYILDNILELCA